MFCEDGGQCVRSHPNPEGIGFPRTTIMTKKKEIEIARKFFDLIFREVENGEDVIYDFIDPECRYKTLCDQLNNETVKEVLELGFKQKYGEEWHGGKGENDD